MTTTDSLILAADGITIPLRDGTSAPIRFGFRALHQIEQRFGDFEEIGKALSEGSSKIDNLVFVLWCGLVDGGMPMSHDEAFDVLDTQHTAAYSEAMSQAFTQAFGNASAQAGDADPNG